MLNINSYNDFLFESKDDGGFVPNTVYHNSPSIINNLTESPMWFSLDLKNGEEYYNNRMFDSDESYLYEGIVKDQIPHIYSDSIVNLFNDGGIDIEEWIGDIVSNPDEEEVMSLDGTKLLMNNGYSGIIYPDYDPSDSNKDIDTLIIFNPRKTVTGFRLIKASN
jgi:hypothetical protein